MHPVLVVTRPGGAGLAFADKVMQALGRDLPVILSPAAEIVPLEVAVPEADQVIFTSVHGVAQAARLGIAPGASAWCVGDRTAQAAQAAGYQARSAGGDADALVALILEERPAGALLHVAGAQRRGEVAERLAQAGLTCTTLVAYRQRALPPSAALIAAAAGNVPLVSPVFSPRSAAPLALPDRRAPLHGIAMSPAVADALTDLGADTVVTVPRPDAAEMIAATCAVLQRLLDRG